MSISIRGKLRVISYCIYLSIWVVITYLLWIKTVSFDQAYILFFGLIGVLGVTDIMLKINEESILVRNRILIGTILSPTIIFLTVLLLFSPIDSNISVITIAVVGLSITLTISSIDWKAKRKAKAHIMQPTIKK
jgi:hypothetical protein